MIPKKCPHQPGALGSMGARGTGRGDDGHHRDPRPDFSLSQVDKICQELMKCPTLHPGTNLLP